MYGKMLCIGHSAVDQDPETNFLYIQSQFAAFVDASVQSLERERLSAILINQLLSLPLETRLAHIQKLGSDPRAQTAMDYLICSALAPSAETKSIPEAEQLRMLKQLNTAQQFLPSLAALQWAKADLHQLPESLLQFYANALTAKQLIQLAQTRPHLLLLAQALRASLAENKVEDGPELLLLIERRLEQLSEPLELELFLSQIRVDAEKQRYRPILLKINQAGLETKIKLLFQCYAFDKPIAADSLLYDCFTELLIRQECIEAAIYEKPKQCFTNALSPATALQLLHQAEPSSSLASILRRRLLKDIKEYVLAMTELSLQSHAGLIDLLLLIPELLAAMQHNEYQHWEVYSTNESKATANTNKILFVALLKTAELATRDSITALGYFDAYLMTMSPILPYTAVTFWLSLFRHLMQPKHCSEARALFPALHSLFQQSSTKDQGPLLNSLTVNETGFLISNGLALLAEKNLSVLEASRYILELLCRFGRSQSASFQDLLRNHLNEKDLFLFTDPDLVDFANAILERRDRSNLDRCLTGVWIQRLLVSPRMVAMLSLDQFEQLIDRYRLISFTLKKDQYEKISRFLQGGLLFSQQSASLSKLQQEILADPERRAPLEKKMLDILQFRVQDCLTVLLCYLEEACLELPIDQQETREAALAIVYSYYSKRLRNQHWNRFFSGLGKIHQRYCLNKGDLELAQSSIYQWLDRYLPQLSFEQSELLKKQSNILFDAKGKRVGYINEEGLALSFNENSSCLMIEQADFSTETAFYSEAGIRIGYVNAYSRFIEENLFQSHSSALIIAFTPLSDLTDSKSGFNLLLIDLCKGSKLPLLYQQQKFLEDSEKRRYVETSIIQLLIKEPSLLTQALLHELVNELQTECLLQYLCLANKLHKQQNFLLAMFATKQHREQLSSENLSKLPKSIFSPSWFATLFNQHYSDPELAHLLSLVLVGDRSEVQWLYPSLELVFKEQEFHQGDQPVILSTILARSLSEENLAKLFLEQFERKRQASTFISTCKSTVFELHRFYTLDTLLEGCYRLNQEEEYSCLYQSRFLLHLLAYKFMDCGQSNIDLLDSDLYRELLLFLARCRTSTKFSTEERTSLLSISRLILVQIAKQGMVDPLFKYGSATCRFEPCILNLLTESVQSEPKSLSSKMQSAGKSLFEFCSDSWNHYIQCDEDQNHAEQMPESWQAELKQSRQNLDVAELSIASLFLLNFSGKATLLAELINGYLCEMEARKRPAVLKQLFYLLKECADSELAAIVFQELTVFYQAHPDTIDHPSVKNLFDYFLSRKLAVLPSSSSTELILENGLETSEADTLTAVYLDHDCNFFDGIRFIAELGAKKQYQLIISSVEYLARDKIRLSIYQLRRLHLLAFQAQLELFLMGHLEQFYFPVLAFVLRSFYYFFDSSLIVKAEHKPLQIEIGTSTVNSPLLSTNASLNTRDEILVFVSKNNRASRQKSERQDANPLPKTSSSSKYGFFSDSIEWMAASLRPKANRETVTNEPLP